MTNWKTKIKIWLYEKLDFEKKGYLVVSDILAGFSLLSVSILLITAYVIVIVELYKVKNLLLIPIIVLTLVILLWTKFGKTKLVSYNEENTNK